VSSHTRGLLGILEERAAGEHAPHGGGAIRGGTKKVRNPPVVKLEQERRKLRRKKRPIFRMRHHRSKGQGAGVR